MKILSFTILVYIYLISNSYAYLDPASGSFILQTIIAFLATVGSAIMIWWKKIKSKIKSIFQKKKPQ